PCSSSTSTTSVFGASDPIAATSARRPRSTRRSPPAGNSTTLNAPRSTRGRSSWRTSSAASTPNSTTTSHKRLGSIRSRCRSARREIALPGVDRHDVEPAFGEPSVDPVAQVVEKLRLLVVELDIDVPVLLVGLDEIPPVTAEPARERERVPPARRLDADLHA